MSALLDECVPKTLLKHLAGHDVMHALDLGWGGKKNGELLKAMREAGYTILVTIDNSLVHQQNMKSSGIALITLNGKSNRLEDLMPLVPAMLNALSSIVAGDCIELS